jgi:hypothetical protein
MNSMRAESTGFRQISSKPAEIFNVCPTHSYILTRCILRPRLRWCTERRTARSSARGRQGCASRAETWNQMPPCKTSHETRDDKPNSLRKVNEAGTEYDGDFQLILSQSLSQGF